MYLFRFSELLENEKELHHKLGFRNFFSIFNVFKKIFPFQVLWLTAVTVITCMNIFDE